VCEARRTIYIADQTSQVIFGLSWPRAPGMTRNADQIQGDIGQPDLIGPVGDKVLVQQVYRHGERMLAVGRTDSIAARRPRPDAILSHEPRDPLAADAMSFGAQFA
jgi:hypothetical protein